MSNYDDIVSIERQAGWPVSGYDPMATVTCPHCGARMAAIDAKKHVAQMIRPDGNTPAGTRLRLTRDVQQYGRTVLTAGTEATLVHRPFGPHATSNGGGWDCTLTIPGRRFPSAFWAGEWHDHVVDDASDSVNVHSGSLEIVQ